MGLFQAILEAISLSDDDIAGQRVTRLVSPMTSASAAAPVESTSGFGYYEDGTGISLIMINGEIIHSTGRGLYSFNGLTRGYSSSDIPDLHREGSLVFDVSWNKSAKDLVRRSMLSDHALGEDLDIIGANYGLRRCPGLTEAQWREIVQTIAWLPKGPLDSYREALFAYYEGDTSAYNVREDLIRYPNQVFVEITIALADALRGRWILNGQEPALTTGANSVDVDYPINQVLGVYLDTPLTRRGYRRGLTNFATSNTFVGQTITLDTSPGGVGTGVIVDYGACTGHYLATDETERDDGDDFYPYLSDPSMTVRCLLNQIRSAGKRINFSLTT